MSTAKLDQIVRQKDPELKTAVEYLARGDVSEGIRALRTQGRIREIADPAERVREIARDFAESPTNTLVVSPDNASRRELNNAIRTELQSKGIVARENHALKGLGAAAGPDWCRQTMGSPLRRKRPAALLARQQFDRY